jgi:hypothetical protein
MSSGGTFCSLFKGGLDLRMAAGYAFGMLKTTAVEDGFFASTVQG